MTVADRESRGNLVDFKFMLRATVERGKMLPSLERWQVGALKEAASAV